MFSFVQMFGVKHTEVVELFIQIAGFALEESRGLDVEHRVKILKK